MWFIIWVLLIVLCKIDSHPTCFYSHLKVLNQNLKLKFHQMDFWFEFLNIHMNGKTITCHNCHGFKWKNINFYQILIFFLCGLMPFLACWIVTTPICTWEPLWTFQSYILLALRNFFEGNIVTWFLVFTP
jgi:hypothetical protein